MPRRYQVPPVGDPNDPQGMAVLMEKFLESLRVKNFSADTVIDRHVYIAYFIHWAQDRGLVRPSEISKPIIERYQRYLFHYRKKNGDPLTFGSQHHHLVVLRMWFRWLARQNYLLYNPASDIELPKLEYRLPKFVLTAAEAELVVNQPNVDTAGGIRDRAILETFYSTGMRRKELTQLKVYDLDSDRGTVAIRQGKGKKDRIIPIGDRALAWIGKYVQEVRPGLLLGGSSGDVLFLTDQGVRHTPEQLTQKVTYYIDAADIGKKGSCHLFRHTMATLMLENGADIRFIQAMLGHVRLDTTQIYTRVSIRKLKEIHTATHPARLKRATARDQLPRDWPDDMD